MKPKTTDIPLSTRRAAAEVIEEAGILNGRIKDRSLKSKFKL